ncbi:MAG: hypothetical protein J6023_01490 [Clostridia bacterium]|nr:hypothetical protein [Clostridia bacterium]
MKKQMKWIVPCVILVAAVLVIALIAIISTNREAGALTVTTTKGIVSVTRGSENAFLSEGQKIKPGDTVSTDASSCARIQVGQSILLLEPESEIKYERIKEGDETKTVFRLLSGSVLTDLKAENEYTVSVDPALDVAGSGFFGISLIQIGTVSTVRTTLVSGQLSAGDATLKESLKALPVHGAEDGSWTAGDVEDAVLMEFSDEAISYLRERVREGEKLPFTDTELLKIMADKNKSFRITFYDHKGEIFVSTQVKSGERVKKPRLSPTFTGHWDFDFSTPITSDTDVFWVEDE